MAKLRISTKMKTCSKCKAVKSETLFSPRSDRKSGRFSWCKKCCSAHVGARQKTKNDADGGFFRKNNLLAKYKISLGDYNDLFNNQDGCCAICKSHQSLFKKSLSVDRCHKTKNVRGLLCSKCNTALGLMQENPAVIQNALFYVMGAIQNAPY